ncbi:MAG: GNAT family N-acetyltransferase [Candidatus Xenobia bacterium]
MGDSPYYRAFPDLRLALPFEEWHRLPRNPAFKYEYIEGQARMTPRPATATVVLPLHAWQPIKLRRPPRVRQLQERDWKTLHQVFYAAFFHEMPFHCLSERKAKALARSCMQHTREGGDGELVHAASVVAESERSGVEGAALITLVNSEHLVAFPEYRTMLPPGEQLAHLTWIFVNQYATRRGIGTALLHETVQRLRELGHLALTSTFIIGSHRTMLWHWQMGFRLVPSGFSHAWRLWE